ncbi:hypothetical protein [Kordiimonas aestuarii]|uniref:hypothetical protein n=1 Tax=Kordiimonas aestuarii TaxID=1005925 RepID=UPI0021D1B27D|nr:hypothetical protein [Kordiimonas aestuarii]
MSVGASATYPNGQTIADAGTYSPVSLGSNIILDACGSSFAGYSICDLPSTNKFGIEWFILRRNTQYNYDEWLAQYTYHQGQVAPNLQKTIATGGSNVINTAGTYFIGLHVISYGDTIALPGGGYAQGGSSDWSWSGYFTVAEGPITPTVPPSSVPEPLSALLLLPGLALIARRERRKRHAAIA